jgi:hypothetical protein
VDVGLEVAEAEIDRLLEGEHRVLEGKPSLVDGTAAVRERDGQAVVVKVRIVGRSPSPAHTDEYGRSSLRRSLPAVTPVPCNGAARY